MKVKDRLKSGSGAADSSKTKKNLISRLNSVIVSLSFFWLLPLLRKCYFSKKNSQDLEEVELDLVLPAGNGTDKQEQDARKLGEDLERCWTTEINHRRHPSFPKALIFCFKSQLLRANLIYAVETLILRVTIVLLTKFFISSTERTQRAIYGLGICLVTFLQLLFFNHAMVQQQMLGLSIRMATTNLLHRKLLRLSHQSKTKFSEILNLVSTELQKDVAPLFLSYLYSAPIQVLIFLWLIWGEFGPASVAGFGITLLLVPLQFLQGKLVKKLSAKISRKTSERQSLIAEMLKTIRVIKLYGWEAAFIDRVEKTRNDELKLIRRSRALQSLFLAVFEWAGKWMTFVALLFTSLMNQNMTGASMFLVLAVFTMLHHTLNKYLPRAIVEIMQFKTTLGRVQEILMLDECGDGDEVETSSGQEGQERCEQSGKPEAEVSLRNVSCCLNGHSVLKDVNLNCCGAQLVVICGTAGSGKTALLTAILKELPISSGGIDIHSNTSISYASQTAWIFPGTVRDNILCGRPLERKRYNEILDVCCLTYDLQQLPQGDQTWLRLGTDVALSGGQKSRVNLARALYQDGDVVLLDDPLCALDAKTSRHIFKECILGLLKNKLRIIVSNNMELLRRAEKIVVMEGGRILEQATYSKLMEQGHFRHFESETQLITPKATKSTEIDPPVEVRPQIHHPSKDEMKAQKENCETDRELYWNYFMEGNSKEALVGLLLVYLVAIGTRTFVEFGFESMRKGTRAPSTTPISSPVFCQHKWTNSTNRLQPFCSWSTSSTTLNTDITFTSGIYVLFLGSLLAMLTHAFRHQYFADHCQRTSASIHRKMVSSIARARIAFFETHSVGTILNLFSANMNTLDDFLPELIAMFVSFSSVGILFVLAVAMADPSFILPGAVFMWALWKLVRLFSPSIRVAKNLEVKHKGTILTHFSCISEDLVSARHSTTSAFLNRMLEAHQDREFSSRSLGIILNRGLGLWTDLVSFMFMVYVLVILTFSQTGENEGMILSTWLGTISILQLALRIAAEADAFMISFARARTLALIEPEPSAESNLSNTHELLSNLNNNSTEPNKTKIAISFQNATITHNGCEKQAVLRNVTFDIRKGEKVGIIGRTGSGKSTLISSMLKLAEISEGELLINGMDINSLAVSELRNQFAVVQQDSLLFSGTLRYNLDPMNSVGGDEMREVLEELRINYPLDFLIQDHGSNLSVGEKQLICICRALVHSWANILVFDEALSCQNPETEKRVQSLIKKRFPNATVLSIAHKLGNLETNEYDKILLVENGAVNQIENHS